MSNETGGHVLASPIAAATIRSAQTDIQPLESIGVSGKFLVAGGDTHYLRGVTYGGFSGPGWFPHARVVRADFEAMANCGVNAVRTYDVPPAWMLELAVGARLRLLVGIPWEQHVTFLDSRTLPRSIERRVVDAVRSCRASPAVLGYVVGNEIPPGIVRWHGRRRVERFIERLYRAAKLEDPSRLVTYANYPSTEYLDLPFLDVLCVNLFLEQPERLRAYLAELQTIAADRPLIVSELGLDSRRNGTAEQARSISAQVTTAFDGACAGCFVFSWTDEWARDGALVDDWDFGVVDRAREPKPALHAMRAAYGDLPFEQGESWPRVSVVVCSYNGADRIASCVDALAGLDYPDYEVIVVDDGSTDATAALARTHGVRVISTGNAGLSAARNTGTAAADGEIVAFCDDDCEPDRHWLRYLVRTLRSGDYAGVGGPNIAPPSSLIGDAVAHAPGGPTHVLLTATAAEHIPGCNMAFRRGVLERMDGFDRQFVTAGDDVDICWRVQDADGVLGFSPGAVVWHHPRATVRGYLRQQVGYGRAEAMLERKWPARYTGTGHVEWGGRVHGGKAKRSLARRRWQVYYGRAAGALFQSVYGRRDDAGAFPLAPEWYLVVLALIAASIWLMIAHPMLPAVQDADLPLGASLITAGLALIAGRASLWTLAVLLPPSMPVGRRLAIRTVTFWLCLLQPVARLVGRTGQGLTPWRLRGRRAWALPRPRTAALWSDRGLSSERWAQRLERALARSGARVLRGGDYDTWDLQVHAGSLATARVRLAVEEHGHGRQMVRVRVWPRLGAGGALVAIALLALSMLAFAGELQLQAVVLGAAAAVAATRVWLEASACVATPIAAVAALNEHEGDFGTDHETTVR